MVPHGIRYLSCLTLLAAVLSQATAQDDKQPPVKDKDKAKAPAKAEPPPPSPDDYRQYFKKPETPVDYLKAIQFEIEVGRYDLAAAHLHNLVASKPADKDLADLEENVGIAAFLRLRNVPKWSPDARVQAQAKKDVDTLLDMVSTAVRKQRTDPQRIATFVKNLTASEEERAFALKELYRSGAAVIPPLIDELRNAEGSQHAVLLHALQQLVRPETVPPLAAALDSNDVTLQVELMDLFRRKLAKEAVPALWSLAGAPNRPEVVRTRAAETLGTLLETPVTRLPLPKVALTQVADRYYKHQVSFPDPNAVTVWRWDGNHVVAGWPGAATIPASRAEEYYGLHYAKQALTIDPTYRPAQVIALSLALDQAYAKGDLSQPLAKVAPAVYDLLATVNPELVTAALDRALTEQRLPVILGCVRMLGDLADVRANLPATRGEPALVRALYYPDRRVSFAAADALLRIPGPPPANTSARIVDLLRRALATEPQAKAVPKVLVGFASEDLTNQAAATLARAGYEPVRVTTGRDALRRLNAASDLDELLLDANLPEPGLASLLAQLRTDPSSGRLPILLATAPEQLGSLQRYVERFPNVTVIPAALALDDKAIKEQINARLAEPGSQPLSEAEQKEYAEKAVRALARMAKGELPGYDIRPAADALFAVLHAGKLSPEGLTAAIEAIGRLTGPQVPTELLNVILDAKRPLPLRLAAATELLRHIQKHSPALTRAQVESLVHLHAQAETDATLRAKTALVLGSLRPDAKATGERLLQYQPPPPGAPVLVPEK
jgi:CheY-like chemotaxis protein